MLLSFPSCSRSVLRQFVSLHKTADRTCLCPSPDPNRSQTCFRINLPVIPFSQHTLTSLFGFVISCGVRRGGLKLRRMLKLFDGRCRIKGSRKKKNCRGMSIWIFTDRLRTSFSAQTSHSSLLLHFVKVSGSLSSLCSPNDPH